MLKGDTPAQDRITEEQFEALCSIQCTREEIASVFQVDSDTLNTWCKRTYGDTFSVIYKRHSDKGKMSLRRIQYNLAEKNPSMAIWLGKQYLGQKDNVEANINGEQKIIIKDDLPEENEQRN